MRPRVMLAVAVLAAISATSCGYRMVRYGGKLGDARSVAIPTLENDSVQLGAEVMVTEALRSEFLRRGAVQVVSDPGAADWVLHGSVHPLVTQGRTFSGAVFTIEYRVTLRLSLVVERSDGTFLELDRNALTESEIYLANPDVEASRKSREEALRRLSKLLASRVYDAIDEEQAP